MAESSRGYAMGAAVWIVSATFIVWAAATRSPSLHVPPMVKYAVALIFAVVAVRLMQLRANIDGRLLRPAFGTRLACGAALVA